MTRFTFQHAALPAALLLVGLTHAAGAQAVFFPNNTTINYALGNNAVVGYANASDYGNKAHGTSPTIGLVNGGSTGYISLYNSSTLNMTGGNLGSTTDQNLNAYDTSLVNISGGIVGEQLQAHDHSVVNMSGGQVVGYIVSNQNSIINISGGTLNALSIVDNGDINFFGTGLTATSAPSNVFGTTLYLLGGKLVDGTSINGKGMYVLNGSNARFTLNPPVAVPEPGSIALIAGLGVMGAGLLARKRCALR